MFYLADVNYGADSDKIIVAAGNYTEAMSIVERDYTKHNLTIYSISIELINDTNILNIPEDLDIEGLKEVQQLGAQNQDAKLLYKKYFLCYNNNVKNERKRKIMMKWLFGSKYMEEVEEREFKALENYFYALQSYFRLKVISKEEYDYETAIILAKLEVLEETFN